MIDLILTAKEGKEPNKKICRKCETFQDKGKMVKLKPPSAFFSELFICDACNEEMKENGKELCMDSI